QIHEIGEHDGCPYLSLEHVPGGTLAQRLAERPLPPRDAAELIRQLALAVDFAHRQGVIHRDLKPANVLLKTTEHTEDTEKRQTIPLSSSVSSVCSVVPKITDFGLAKLVEGSPSEAAAGARTQSGAILGTPSYMAPEQAQGRSQDIGPP